MIQLEASWCNNNRNVDKKNLAKEVQTTRPILDIYFWRCSCTCARARPGTSRPGNRPWRLRREKDGRELGACWQLCFVEHCQHLHYQPLKTATHNHHYTRATTIVEKGLKRYMVEL